MAEPFVAGNTSPRALATINLSALITNLKLAITHCPQAEVIPVVKANAYGHGMYEVAESIVQADLGITHFAVATADEALTLRAQLKTLSKPTADSANILLLGGFNSLAELRELLAQGVDPVMHSPWHIKQLVQQLEAGMNLTSSRLWLKLDTGMHRLGMTSDECLTALPALYSALQKAGQGQEKSTEIVIMSHLASADNESDKVSLSQTRGQLQLFEEFIARASQSSQFSASQFTASFAASTGILSLPQTHHNYVRPGVMLYGSSPFSDRTAKDIGLQSVMTLSSRIVAIRNLQAGERIGYGGTFQCQKPTRMAVVSIGYADGYPRAAGNGTPVLVRVADTKGNASVHRCRLIGRVSMDMITIDLTDIPQADVGDEVVLWGEGLPADEVASHAGTIAYELFCIVTARVSVHYKRN